MSLRAVRPGAGRQSRLILPSYAEGSISQPLSVGYRLAASWREFPKQGRMPKGAQGPDSAMKPCFPAMPLSYWILERNIRN